jgi:hypothetical protein
MRLRDVLDPEWALSALMKLAVCLIFLSCVLQFVACVMQQFSPAAEFAMLCVFFLLSPLAYLIRRIRQGRPQRPGARRGAERTPLLPQNEEVE